MKKNMYSLIVVLLSMFLLVGCSLNTLNYPKILSYREWYEQVKLNEKRNIYYEEKEGTIFIQFKKVDKSSERTKEYFDFINEHNNFIKENSDYFPSEVDIICNAQEESQYSPIVVYSTADNDSPIRQLGREEDGSFQYVELSMTNINYFDIGDNEIKLPVLIIRMNADSHIKDYEKYFRVLKHFTNLEQIVLHYDKECDPKETIEALHQLEPDVEIYYYEDKIFKRY